MVVDAWIEGDELPAWLAAQSQWRVRVAMFRRIALALAALHARGLVHGSFGVDKVIVGSDNEPTLLVGDLGGPATAVARESALGPIRVRRTSVHIGPTMESSVVVAPGVGRRVDVVPDEMSDQLAFCRSAWSALFEADDSDVHRSRPASRSRAAVADILRRGQSTATVDRWTSMSELADALERSVRPANDGRRGWFVAAAVGVGMLAAVRPMFAAERESPCAADSLRVHAAWMGAPRERVDATLIGDPRPFTTELSARIDGALTDYAEDWSVAWKATCTASRESTTEGAERRACLERAAERVEVYVEQLERPDSRSIEHLPNALAALPPPQGCSESRVWDGSLAADINRGIALVDIGAVQAAQARVGQLSVRARQRGVNPPGLEHLRGRVAAASGDRTLAEASYARAFEEAMAVRADRVAMVVAHDQCKTIVASGPARASEALVWCDVARSLSERIGEPFAIERTRLRAVRASVLRDLGAPKDAAALLDEALRAEAAATREDGIEAARLHRALARVRGELGQPRRARAEAERAVAIHEMLLGPHHPQVVGLQFELGHYYRAEGNSRGALDAYQRVLVAAEANPQSEAARLKDVLLALSTVYAEERRPDEAHAASARAAAVAGG